MTIPIFKGDSNNLENMIGVAEMQSSGLVVTLKPGHELSRSDFEATFGSIGYEILILVGATNEDLKISSARIRTYLVDPQFNAFFKEHSGFDDTEGRRYAFTEEHGKYVMHVRKAEWPELDQVIYSTHGQAYKVYSIFRNFNPYREHNVESKVCGCVELIPL